MQEKNIKSLRKEIDSIDDQLLELINQRTSIVDKLVSMAFIQSFPS